MAKFRQVSPPPPVKFGQLPEQVGRDFFRDLRSLLRRYGGKIPGDAWRLTVISQPPDEARAASVTVRIDTDGAPSHPTILALE